MPDQPNIHIETGNSSDHDLLLTLKAEVTTKLDRVISDVKDLKDDLAARVSDLESEKVSQTEFATYKESMEKDRVEFKRAVDLTIEDHEKRIRSNTAWIQYGLGAVAGIEAILAVYQIYKTFHP